MKLVVELVLLAILYGLFSHRYPACSPSSQNSDSQVLASNADRGSKREFSSVSAAGKPMGQLSLSLRFRSKPYFLFSASNSSIVLGQSFPSSRDKLRSASTLPPVWHRAQ
jgi:hypothetical protein